jgi:hypothetical protein
VDGIGKGVGVEDKIEKRECRMFKFGFYLVDSAQYIFYFIILS